MLRIDHRHIGNRLGKRNVNGTAGIQTAVKFIFRFAAGTFFHARAAPGTAVFPHKPGFFANGHRKIPHITRHLFHFTVGIQVDVFILGRFHHFRGENTGRTVQCGEGFIQLCHFAADGGFLFHDIHFVPGVSHIQRRRQSGNTAANDQRPAGPPAAPGRQRRIAFDFCYGRPHQDNGFIGRFFPVFVNPGTLFPDVGNFHHIGVEPFPLRRPAERGFVHTG